MYDSREITGFAGRRVLEGEIKVEPSKNGAIPALATSLLFDGQVTLKNIPSITDIDSILRALLVFGARFERKNDTINMTIEDSDVINFPVEEVEKTRGIISLTGPLLARRGSFSISKCRGGCSIGERPINFYLDFYRALGAKVEEKEDGVVCSAETLIGTEFTFEKKSVVATYTAVMTAVLAKGTTVLKNTAIEPEVTTILSFLKANGAKIEGISTETLTIEGTGGKLLKPTESFVNQPDRIETCSLILLGVLSAKNLLINNCNPEEVKSVIEVLRNIGFDGLEVKDKSILIKPQAGFELKNCNPFRIETEEYPGFPTDVQTMMIVLATQLGGTSYIKENIFEDRIENQSNSISNFGAQIKIKVKNEIEVMGPTELLGTEVDALDIRAGFASILAATIAKGESKINNIELIGRGYQNIWERLRLIGLIFE